MATYGYARVSTTGQDLEGQVKALEAAGCERVFTDKLTGSTMDRPGFRSLMKVLEPGDKLVVTKLDRLGRTLRGILETVDDLKERQVEFRSLGDSIDTSSAFGRAFMQLVGVFAELERSLIVERTTDGRRLAQSKGVKFGRKRALTPADVTMARELLDTGQHTVSEVAGMLKINRSTLWRSLRTAGVA